MTPTRLRPLLLAAALVALPARAELDAPLVRPLGGVRAPDAALLARGGSGGALRMQATALPVAYPAEGIPVLVVVELDGPALVAHHPGGRLGVELTLYAVDTGGRVAAVRSEGAALDLDRRGADLASAGLRWQASLALAPGEWSLRVLARVRQTGAFGLRETRLTLPRPTAAGPFFLAPAAPPASGWIDAPSPDLDPAAAAAIAALGGPPAALPLLGAEAPARLWALVAGGDTSDFAVRLSDGLGRPAGEPLATAGERRPLGPGLAAVALELAPPGGAAGLRDLALAARGGALRAAPWRFVLRPGQGAGAWTDLLRVAAVSEESSALTPAPVAPPASKEDRERFAAAYREAWRRWAAGDPEGAVGGLQTFEEGALAADKRRAMFWLEQADRPLAAEVLEARPGAALPLALFYGELFRAHLAAGRIGLARRAETRAADLLARFAASAESAAQKELAAAALEGMAADLLAAEAPQRAADLLERATRLAPRRIADWVALAAIHERDRRLETALLELERALALDPGHREARLRRARIERLRGNERRAGEILDALAAELVTDWIGVVAVQERTRQLLGGGEVAAAVALLERAAARFPTEPSLALALSYAYERSGRRGEARAAAERAVSARSTFAAAPRKRYAAPPIEPLAAGRAEVEAAGLLASADLARALDAVPAGGAR